MSDGKTEALEYMAQPSKPEEGTPEYFMAVASDRLARFRTTGDIDVLINAENWARCAQHHMKRIRMGVDR